MQTTIAHFACVLARFLDFMQTKSRRNASSTLQRSSSFASYASVASIASSALNVSSALTAARKDPPHVLRLHMDIDRLLKDHGLDASSAVHMWEPLWVAQRSQLRSVSQSALAAISEQDGGGENASDREDDEAHQEAELLAAFELAQYGASCGVTVGRLLATGNLDNLFRLKLPRWFVAPSEIDVQAAEELGRGSFGSVHSGRWFDTPVVVKRVFIDPAHQKTIVAQFRHEADVWFQLNHINVVKMYGACHVGDPFFLCEFASGGDIDAYLRQKGRGASLIWYSLLNAALGLQYLHDNGVVHGDLKANNVLVGADGVVKLADFGLSTSTRGNQIGAHTGGALGAYRWKAPECLLGESATFASDVYSFAMVMIELVSGVVPWGPDLDDAVVKYRTTRGELPLQPREMADSEWRLIQRMCCRDPTERVTIDAVVVHLSSLLEQLDLHMVRPSARGAIPKRSFKNRVVSRGGALLSLLAVAKSGNKRVSKLTGEHLLAVHLNRGARSDRREVEGIVDMLVHGNEAEKAWAAEAISSLSWHNEANRSLIQAANGIGPMVSLVRDDTNAQKVNAASALIRLALSAKHKVLIAAAGAIDPLVKLVRDGTDAQKDRAAGALRNLT